MLTVLEQLDNGSYVSPDDPGEPVANKPRISITDEEGKFLKWLAHGKRVLEIGTGLGVSTRHLMSASELSTCDIDPWVQDNVWTALQHERDNLFFLPYYDRARGPFDMVFIDGEHSSDQTRKDAMFALSVVRGVVVVHDAHIPSVMRGLRGLADWQTIDTTHGLATAWKWDG